MRIDRDPATRVDQQLKPVVLAGPNPDRGPHGERIEYYPTFLAARRAWDKADRWPCSLGGFDWQSTGSRMGRVAFIRGGLMSRITQSVADQLVERFHSKESLLEAVGGSEFSRHHSRDVRREIGTTQRPGLALRRALARLPSVPVPLFEKLDERARMGEPEGTLRCLRCGRTFEYSVHTEDGLRQVRRNGRIEHLTEACPECGQTRCERWEDATLVAEELETERKQARGFMAHHASQQVTTYPDEVRLDEPISVQVDIIERPDVGLTIDSPMFPDSSD